MRRAAGERSTIAAAGGDDPVALARDEGDRRDAAGRSSTVDDRRPGCSRRRVASKRTPEIGEPSGPAAGPVPLARRPRRWTLARRAAALTWLLTQRPRPWRAAPGRAKAPCRARRCGRRRLPRRRRARSRPAPRLRPRCRVAQLDHRGGAVLVAKDRRVHDRTSGSARRPPGPSRCSIFLACWRAGRSRSCVDSQPAAPARRARSGARGRITRTRPRRSRACAAPAGAEDLLGGAVLDEVAEVHERDVVADAVGLLEVVGDDHDRQVVRSSTISSSMTAVERGSSAEHGSSMQQHLGPHGERARDAQPLLLAARQPQRGAVEVVARPRPTGRRGAAPPRPAAPARRLRGRFVACSRSA